MTVTGWITFGVLVFLICSIESALFLRASSRKEKTLYAIVGLIIIVVVLCGMLWFFNNTASGRRMLVDQKSDFGGGIERTVTVYTADGEIIAQYEGKIDIETNDGGYVKFDFEGKRYIYYNCFVETIADIAGDGDG